MTNDELFAALAKKYKSSVVTGGAHLQIESLAGGKFRAFFATGKFVHCASDGRDTTIEAATRALAARAGVLPQPQAQIGV